MGARLNLGFIIEPITVILAILICAGSFTREKSKKTYDLLNMLPYERIHLYSAKVLLPLAISLLMLLIAEIAVEAYKLSFSDWDDARKITTYIAGLSLIILSSSIAKRAIGAIMIFVPLVAFVVFSDYIISFLFDLIGSNFNYKTAYVSFKLLVFFLVMIILWERLGPINKVSAIPSKKGLVFALVFTVLLGGSYTFYLRLTETTDKTAIIEEDKLYKIYEKKEEVYNKIKNAQEKIRNMQKERGLDIPIPEIPEPKFPKLLSDNELKEIKILLRKDYEQKKILRGIKLAKQYTCKKCVNDLVELLDYENSAVQFSAYAALISITNYDPAIYVDELLSYSEIKKAYERFAKKTVEK